jgi:hypothetical protein
LRVCFTASLRVVRIRLLLRPGSARSAVTSHLARACGRHARNTVPWADAETRAADAQRFLECCRATVSRRRGFQVEERCSLVPDCVSYCHSPSRHPGPGSHRGKLQPGSRIPSSPARVGATSCLQISHHAPPSIACVRRGLCPDVESCRCVHPRGAPICLQAMALGSSWPCREPRRAGRRSKRCAPSASRSRTGGRAKGGPATA